MDYTVVQQVRDRVAERLRTERRIRAERGEPELTRADERALGAQLLSDAVAEWRATQLAAGHRLPDAAEDSELVEAARAALFGLGRLQPLIDDASLNNIEIIGADRVWLYRTDGYVDPGLPVADSDEELIAWVRNAGTYGGLSSRPFDLANPWLETRLPDGSRLCAIMGVTDRPTLSIRLYRQQRVTLDELRALGAFGQDVQDFLEASVRTGHNLMVSGATFAGKTTLLRALGAAIPFDERLVTCEHFLELGFHHHPDAHRDVVALEERLPNAEGRGGLSVADLVERSRRMNPSRIIVGEVIGGEILAMLDAMTQGNAGSLSTIHAKNATNAITRIALYALRAHGLAMDVTERLAAEALDFLVHVEKFRESDGRIRRRVAEIREILGHDGTRLVSAAVFTAEATGGIARPAAPVSAARRESLAAAGYTPTSWVRA